MFLASTQAANPTATGTTVAPTFGTSGGGFTFGTPAASTGFGFGTSTAAAPASTTAAIPTLGGTGFTFGTGTSAPPAASTLTATIAPQQGAAANPTAAGTTAAPTFGTSGGGFTFGTPAASTGFGFGTSTAAAPASTTAAIPTLGGTGFTFGTGTSAPPAASTLTATIAPQGAAATATPLTLSFGASTTSTTPGAAANSTAAGTTAAPTFGTSGGGFTFGTPAASTGFGFGTSTAAAPTATTAATTTLGGTGFTFGTGTSAPPAASTLTATIAPQGAAATATPLKLSFGAPTTSTTPGAATVPQSASFTGLGGVQPLVSNDPSQVLATGGGTAGGVMRTEERTLKDAPLPIELIELVNGLKNHITSEKNGLAEVASTIGHSIERVSERCENIRQQLGNTSNLIHRQILNCEALKAQVDKDNRDADMARQLLNTPAALQQDQKVSYNYLFNMLQSFQDKIIIYQREILKAEAVLKSTDASKPFTPTDLNLALQSTKDSVIILAAKVKTLHEKILSEVESHQNLLRYMKGSNLSKGMLGDKAKVMPPRHTGPPMAPDKTIDYLTKANVLFPSRYAKSPNKAYADFLDNTAKLNSTQRIFHSTQLAPTPMANASFNTSGFNTSMFHSAASPIFSSEMTSPTGGSSLKRSKH